MKKSFEDRLVQEGQKIKGRAEKLKPGPEQDALLKKVRQLDVAARVNDWVNSPGLQSPT